MAKKSLAVKLTACQHDNEYLVNHITTDNKAINKINWLALLYNVYGDR